MDKEVIKGLLALVLLIVIIIGACLYVYSVSKCEGGTSGSVGIVPVCLK